MKGMKAKQIMRGALLAACMSVVACSKWGAGDGRGIRFHASAGAPETRTSYSNEGTITDGKLVAERINWSTGDVITIYSPQAAMPDGETHAADYTVSSYEANSVTVSRATIEPSGESGLEWGTGTHTFYAMYPSVNTAAFTSAEKAKIGLTGTQMTGTIPSTQVVEWNGQMGTPRMRYAYMFATATSEAEASEVNLPFEPEFTAFQFTVGSGENASVSLTSFTLETTATGDNAYLAGDFTLTNATKAVSVAAGASKSITVDLSGKTVTSSSPLTFTILALPVAITNLRITFTGTEIGTRTLELNDSDGTPLDFTACRKYTIRGLSFPLIVTAEGEEIEWDEDAVGEDLIWNNALNTPLTLEAFEAGTVTINQKAGQYSLNGSEWIRITSDATVNLNVGDVIQFRNTRSTAYELSYSGPPIVAGTAGCYIYGNIMSMVSAEGFENLTEIPEPAFFRYFFKGNTRIYSHPKRKLLLPATTLTDYCYSYMFYECTRLTSATVELPATTLAPYCYYYMFYGCTGLTSAPELPATTLANNCYYEMFRNCTSLESAPELPATALASNCYRGMFASCSSLMTAPTELPAMILDYDCYGYMFQGCTSLTTAPALPATTLAERCYEWMFEGCTSLTSAPELPATTLANNCYYLMFQNCTSLESAPELPATTLAPSCYSSMFKGCTSLTSAPTELPAPTLADNCYYEMFRNCTSLSTVPANLLPAMTLASWCYSNMFYGCTSLTSAPELPATSLVNSCYYGMFRNCTSLTSAPVLPAATLASQCYAYMFYGCTNLNYIKCLAEDLTATNCLLVWTASIASTGTFVKKSGITWPNGSSGIPNGWTVNEVDE